MGNLTRRMTWMMTAAMTCIAGAVRGDSGPLPTTGEKVNAAIDNVAATGTRMLELPLFMVLMGVVIVAAGLVAAGLMMRTKRVMLRRGMMVTGALVLVFGALFVVDRKIVRLQQDVSDLRTKSLENEMVLRDEIMKLKSAPVTAIAPAPAEPGTVRTTRQPKTPDLVPVVAPAQVKPPAPVAVAAPAQAKPVGLLFDADAAKKALGPVFANLTMRPLRSDAAVNVVQVHSATPLVQMYVAVVDLANPAVGVKIGATLDTKTLTSDFAKKNDCTVAVNGEAGDSPQQGSGFGVWHGNLTVDGKVLMKEAANDLRPFLSFNATSKATFVAMATKDRTVPADGQNVIWGRIDAVVEGVVQTADERLRQPRTAMGVNADGTKLILLVADGRQQGYSVGLMRSEVGTVLKAFGANNGMLCDEGGSSCIYLAPFGIGNAPSDGSERPTYTHFGVVVKE